MGAHMTSVDAAWLHMDQPTNLMVITSVMRFDEPPDWDAVTEALHARVVERYPRFRQLAVDHPVGRPRWQDDPNFDLALHVHRVALPAPGDDAALRAFVGDVMGQDLDRRRPLWQAWLVDGVGDGGAMVVRIHHCVADGMSLMRVLLSMADDPPAGALAEEGHSRLGDLVRTAAAVVVHPTRLLDAARTGVGVARAVAHDVLLSPDATTVFRGPQSARKVVAWTPGIPLAQVKAAARVHGATVNDVLMAALSGALGGYLDAVGTPAGQIRAMVPVYMRPPEAPVPTTLGNHFALVFCPLPVGTRDPVVRLAEVKQAMDHIKATPEAIASVGLLLSMGTSPHAVEEVLVDFFGAKSSMVVTNVRGPSTRVSVAGTPLAGILSWAPQSGPVTASVTIVSYDGVVTVGVATDPALVPDPERIADALPGEVAALAEAAGAGAHVTS